VGNDFLASSTVMVSACSLVKVVARCGLRTLAAAGLSVLISNGQEMSALSFVASMVPGLVTGFIGSEILNKSDHRLVRYVLLSIVGAIVGGFLSNLVGKPGVTGLDFYSLLVSLVGAVVFMIIYHALFRRRRFLSIK